MLGCLFSALYVGQQLSATRNLTIPDLMPARAVPIARCPDNEVSRGRSSRPPALIPRLHHAVRGHGDVAAADHVRRGDRGVLCGVRRHGVGSGDARNRSVQDDLGAPDDPLATLLLWQQLDEVAAVTQIAAADAVAVALPVSHVE